MAKIRTGFVSNSSSSSFCLLGVGFKPKKFGMSDMPDDIFSYFDENDELLSIKCCDSDYLDNYIVGASPNKMKDDQTLYSFKEAVLASLKKYGFTGTIKDISFITGSYYYG